MTKNFNPLVSIIIPIYNGSNYMREAIDSAIAQTYKNIEIIVVNDGSTDNTEEIAKSYGDKIKYYKKENGGVASALNLAIKKSKGEYISWLSHDDVYYSYKIKKQIEELSKLKKEEQKNTILWSNYSLINEKTEITSVQTFQKIHNEEKLNYPVYPIVKGLLHGCTLLIPKKCFEEIGYFDESLKTTQDYDLWFKMFPKYKLIFNENLFVKSRVHIDQNSQIAKVEHEQELEKLWMQLVCEITNEEKKIISGDVFSFLCESYEYVKKNKRSSVVERCLYNKIIKIVQSNSFERTVIIANLATYPARESALKIVVKSIIDQVDVLNIYLNEYNEIPDFLKHPKINCILGKDAKGNLKDNGKFYFINKVPQDSYYFTIDDDIIYPENYVLKMIEKINKYNQNVVVGVHGIVFNENCRSFVEDRDTFDYRKYLLYDKQVSTLGTGTIAFYKKCVEKIALNDFLQTGMADLFFAKYCKLKEIPLIAIERREKWLQDYEIEDVDTLWNKAENNDNIQTDFILTAKLWDIKKILKEMDGNFSVIVSCYNLGELLSKAIDSVFSQTLDNIEIIVVDDASLDEKTKKVLNEIEQDVQVVRLKENGGVSVARNIGVKKAKSEYILCLDADDTIEPTYLEKAKNVFDADESVGIVSCGLQSFGGSNKKFINKDKISIKNALVNSPVHTASCFRKEAHNQCGGYDVQLRGYEDWDHWLGIMKNNWKVRVIPEYLFNYYVRSDSKVNTSNKNAFELVSKIIKNHEELYQKDFEYVIAKKHEDLAKEVNKNRMCTDKINFMGNAVKLKKKFFPKKWM